MNYIFDTSALIVLIEVCDLRKQLEAFSLKNALYVTNRVREEFLDGCKMDKGAINIFLLVPSTINRELLPYFNYRTSSGEFWTISHTYDEKDCICVIDEGFGRDLCDFLKISYTGSIGIIKEMKRQGFLTQKDLENVRLNIKKSKFYLSKKLLVKLDEICRSKA